MKGNKRRAVSRLGSEDRAAVSSLRCFHKFGPNFADYWIREQAGGKAATVGCDYESCDDTKVRGR